ncbi:hypothetical protein FHW79_001771 [Azospirillum sp. OGB3]|uniref:hypothetical protein n=1 Tax=Azospirillum sp. OGB3 TaxID=2587012 RepID=UPI0016058E39|nr:hypothetical protein [Azospirillum sp. OGB3]MBB3264156.1 hypothetical protein [Azospirillum sp. OGB3]
MTLRHGGTAALLGLAGALLASCATGPDPQIARRAQTELVGMPKERLLACAGVPARQAQAGGREYYTYVSDPGVAVSPLGGSSIGVGGFGGGGSSGVGLGLGFGLPLGTSSPGMCEATFVLGPGGTVEQVSYPGNASLSACTPIVQNCVPPAPR